MTYLDQPQRRRVAWLVVAAPAAWMVHLLVTYGLVYVTCRPGGRVWLLLATVTAVTVIVVTAIRERRLRARAFIISEMTELPPDGWRLIAIIGWAMAAFFLLVTMMAGVASALVSPCLM